MQLPNFDEMFKHQAQYPYDEITDKVILPENIEQEIRNILINQGMAEAMKKVMSLTNCGLRISKNYLDKLKKSL